MDPTETEIRETIRKEFSKRYPAFPVTVIESPDDPLVLCVRVYAVPEEKIREVKASVRQLERDMRAGGRHVLLPMVKNLNVTCEHYPEFLPSTAANRLKVAEPPD